MDIGVFGLGLERVLVLVVVLFWFLFVGFCKMFWVVDCEFLLWIDFVGLFWLLGMILKVFFLD